MDDGKIISFFGFVVVVGFIVNNLFKKLDAEIFPVLVLTVVATVCIIPFF